MSGLWQAYGQPSPSCSMNELTFIFSPGSILMYLSALPDCERNGLPKPPPSGVLTLHDGSSGLSIDMSTFM